MASTMMHIIGEQRWMRSAPIAYTDTSLTAVTTAGDRAIYFMAEEDATITHVAFYVVTNVTNGVSITGGSATMTAVGTPPTVGTRVRWRVLTGPTNMDTSTFYYIASTGAGQTFTISTDSGGTNIVTPNATGSGTLDRDVNATMRVGLAQPTLGTQYTSVITWLGGGNGYGDKTSFPIEDQAKFNWVALNTSVNVTRGQMIMLVLDCVSGFTLNEYITVRMRFTGLGQESFPYTASVSGAQGGRDNIGPFLYRSSTKAYGNPIYEHNSLNVSGGTELGIAFTWPGSGINYTVGGVKFAVASHSPGVVPGSMNLYRVDTAYSSVTLLETVTTYFENSGGSFPLNNGHYSWYFDASTLPALTAGQEYILALKCDQQGSQAFQIAYALLDTTYQSAYHPMNLKYVSRLGGNFSETAGRVPSLIPLVYSATGASGLAANPLGGFVR